MLVQIVLLKFENDAKNKENHDREELKK